jgi:type VI secretion system secreted protein Hcp
MAFDCYMKFDSIPGESTDSKHKEWIQILSFSLGVHQGGGTGGRAAGGAAAAGRAEHQDFSVVKSTDKASPKLFLACCQGQHIKSVKLELCRATGDKQKYMEYVLSDVIISSVRPGGGAGGGEPVPLEEVGLNYGKLEIIYTETDNKTGKPKGDVKAQWDLVENKGS